MAGKRVLAFFLAVLIAFALFETFGYYTLTFGGFLLLFVSLSYLTGLNDGIAMCSVLITHFLIEKNMELSFILNEILLFLIGTVVGVIFNLYMPSNRKAVIQDMSILEENLRGILDRMAECILIPRGQKTGSNCNNLHPECINGCSLETEFLSLDNLLKNGLSKAYNNMNNTILNDTRYYLQYFTMRQSQYHILVHIKEQMQLLTSIPKQAEPISCFLKKIAVQLHESNNAEKLLEELSEIKAAYKEEPGPASREEFENRAVLYLILYDLEEFLKIKRGFVLEITDKQIEQFWKQDNIN